MDQKEKAGLALFRYKPGVELGRVLPAGKDDLVKEAKDTIAFFEASPDGKWVSVPYEDGRVVVVDVETGTAEFVQEKETPGHLPLRTVPMWRKAGELTFTRPREDGKGWEVVRWSVKEKKGEVISAGWPRELTEGWLTRREEEATTQGGK